MTMVWHETRLDDGATSFEKQEILANKRATPSGIALLFCTHSGEPRPPKRAGAALGAEGARQSAHQMKHFTFYAMLVARDQLTSAALACAAW